MDIIIEITVKINPITPIIFAFSLGSLIYFIDGQTPNGGRKKLIT